MERGGGLISHADLARYRAIWREPIADRLPRLHDLSMPPASSGGVTMGEILNIMEGYDPLPPFGSPALVHLEAEAMRRAFTDRNTWLGDPGLRARTRSTGCSPRRTPPTLRSEIGDRSASVTPAFDAGRADRAPRPPTTRSWMPTGTRSSCTTTLNNSYGSAVTVTGGRLSAQRRDGRLRHGPGQAEHVRPGAGRGQRDRPGKRMLSAMTPTHRARPGRDSSSWCVGTPGGPRIITMVYHVISNVIDHRMPLPDAVEPRRACTTRACPTGCRSSPAASHRPRSTACARAATRSRDRRLLGRRGGDHPDAGRDGRE